MNFNSQMWMAVERSVEGRRVRGGNLIIRLAWCEKKKTQKFVRRNESEFDKEVEEKFLSSTLNLPPPVFHFPMIRESSHFIFQVIRYRYATTPPSLPILCFFLNFNWILFVIFSPFATYVYISSIDCVSRCFRF